MNPPVSNTVCAICGAALRCGAIGDGTQPDATCWCMTEEKLPASARRPGQGCRCQHCLRKAIAQAQAASGSN
ncbi:signal peptide protein [Ralstonia sp. A12]|uniref:cysteine-rich CWC family protein n=1 Tax=Ralstonia sp. A12 TaxID=1217052 RepID=UPI000575D717|nr:cysteine-rich CWC family protein [Ralstonia sp. A12]KHK57243.1 signal peptide protein [Ralstonia sp. A12]